MSNERLANEMATVLGELQEQMRATAEVHRRRADLTATASRHDGRVTVTVDADGVLLDVAFSDTVDDLSDAAIARAVTAATQQAAREVADRMRDMVQPLVNRREHWPALSDLLPGAMDYTPNVPGECRAPTQPPNGQRRRTTTDTTSPPSDDDID